MSKMPPIGVKNPIDLKLILDIGIVESKKIDPENVVVPKKVR